MRTLPVPFLVVAVVACANVLSAGETKPTIGWYEEPTSSWPAEASDSFLRQLSESADIVHLGPESLTEELASEDLALVVVADAGRVSAELPEALAAYASRGGHLALLGGPFFDRLLSKYGDTRLDHDALLEAVARDVQPRVLLAFDRDELASWQNHSDRRSQESAAVHARPGAAGTPGAFRLHVSAEAGWDTFQSPPLASRPDPEALLATFWAKGDGPRSQVVVEWRERDGSRWMTTVRLSAQWKHYVLPVEAFRYWHDSQVHGRGGKGDRLHPENVASIALGLAQSHAAFAGIKGYRTIWLDEIGFARAPKSLRGRSDLLESQIGMPVIETASPRYKLFPVTNARRLQVNPGQRIAPQVDLPQVSDVYAPTARPDGAGLDRGRPWRFVSLIQSLDEHDRAQASPAALLIPSDLSTGMVLSVPIADPAFFANPAVTEWLGGIVQRMLRGVFLLEGGAKYYASFGEKEMPFGALVVNRGRAAATVRVELAIADPAGRDFQHKDFFLTVPPGEQLRTAHAWTIPPDKGNRYQVLVRLFQDEHCIDQIEHALRVRSPKPAPEFITARAGDFYRKGQIWKAHGVNYMPSSGTACEDQATFEYWMDGRAYGQEIVHRDLVNLKAIGLNSVSAFVYHRSHGDRNLLDFLSQCEELGLKVNLSLRPGAPMDFRWDEIREMIVANRLAEDDTIFAYDLAWEPMWGRRPQRKRYDGDWRAWIDRQYGSLTQAEAAWQFSAPREEGQVVGPSDGQVAADGPWRKMVLDYRRFQNELLDCAYGRARELLRTVDKNHLVSFRMTIAGDPTTSPAQMAFDPAGLARAVDIMEPEGYGRIGDWDKVRPGRFTAAYCRAVAPELPVIWAEFGYSIWDPSVGGPSPDRLDFAARFYDDFLRMAYESGASGTFCWYSCGGYRVNERSDYGILGPDGAWRPQTEVLHRWAGPMTESRPRKAVDRWIPIQLGRDVDGVAGIYRRTEKSFWKAIDAGETPGLRLESAE